ncbi:MAG: AAA family ATPase [Fervidobacterium sp.]|uniref:ATP-binding protein n=1 Tax=Fervidobacterium TaxID=2422 RepID=UPI0030970FD5
MELINEFLKNTKVTRKQLESYTKHPIMEKKYPKRHMYVLLRKYAEDFFKAGTEPRFIGIVGLRGVGKTTLMWQIAEYIYNNITKNMYFFNVNTITAINSNIIKIMQDFQNHILKARFSEYNEPIVLLFDEVHDDPNWAKAMKILYDEARTAFILCTGSSALLINQTPDIARRIKTERLYPLSFTEFVTAKSFYANEERLLPEKGVSLELENALFYSQTIEEAKKRIEDIKPRISDYLSKVSKVFSKNGKEENHIYIYVDDYLKFYNIPYFILYKDKFRIYEEVQTLFTRIIHEDVGRLSDTEINAEQMLKLLIRIAGSDEINIDSISQNYGINKKEIENIISVLEKSEVLNVLNPYGGIDSKLTKNKKAFFMSPTLRMALLYSIYKMDIPEQFVDKIYEDIVVLYVRRRVQNGFLSYVTTSSEKTPDFVLETRDRPILLEVGKGKRTAKQIYRSEIKDYRYGILISKAFDDVYFSENTVKLPLSWFLLI